MTVYAIGATSLIGGAAGALDAEYADDLTDGDPAFVTVKGDKIYHYIGNSTSGAAESSPDVIAPDEASDGVAYSGDYRWILTSVYGVLTATGTPVDNDIAKFTDANTVEGRSYAELKADLDLEIGTDVLAQQTIGIADDNLLEVDGSPNDNEIAKFTANGLEGRTYAELRSDINVEDGADVTDVTNVTAAGALMDSEVDADIKTLSLPASTTISAFGKTLVDDADASTARTTLGVAIGTDVQAYDANNALTTTKVDDFGTPDDNTDLNVTTSYHGLCPKLGGGTTNYLRADGSWDEPPGEGGISEATAIALIIALS
jgi:hypothetical protein